MSWDFEPIGEPSLWASEGEGIDREPMLEPDVTVLMVRRGTEVPDTIWLHAYRTARALICTLAPNRRAGWLGAMYHHALPAADVASIEALQARVRKTMDIYAEDGWERRDPTVWAGDPWDLTSIIDREADF
jgi:hypothetical protein